MIGSFGCNENFPEMLNCYKNLTKSDSLIIPNKCTSFLIPVSFHKLHSNLKSQKKPFVIASRYFFEISKEKKIFEFFYKNGKLEIGSDQMNSSIVKVILLGIRMGFGRLEYSIRTNSSVGWIYWIL